MYSTIIKKTCACGCSKWPTLGYEGYNMDCRPDLKEEKIKKQAERQKARNAVTRTQSKLRQLYKTDDAVREGSKKVDELERWFKGVRRKLTGKCQCGCGKPSSKHDDKYFKHSCSHVFPKSKFPSIATHPRNFVERAFWGGCHTNMDEQSMDKWVNFADWENIKEIFHEVAPLLTDEERTTKFYAHFEKLIYAK